MSETELIALVRRAGDTALALRKQLSVREKTDGSLVSSADERAHEILFKGLSGSMPVVSEEAPETHSNPTNKTSFWLIDPLDGTKDFVAGRSDWSVMVAHIKEGVPVQGVVYAPQHKRLWYAEKGKGTRLYEQDAVRAVTVSAAGEAHGARAVASFSHASSAVERILETLGFSIVRTGSIGVKLGTIASGEAEAYLSEAPLSEWDVAAPQVILEEAGGLATHIDGRPIVYTGTDCRLHGCIASNRLLHKQLVAASRSLAADLMQ